MSKINKMLKNNTENLSKEIEIRINKIADQAVRVAINKEKILDKINKYKKEYKKKLIAFIGEDVYKNKFLPSCEKQALIIASTLTNDKKRSLIHTIISLFEYISRLPVIRDFPIITDIILNIMVIDSIEIILRSLVHKRVINEKIMEILLICIFGPIVEEYGKMKALERGYLFKYTTYFNIIEFSIYVTNIIGIITAVEKRKEIPEEEKLRNILRKSLKVYFIRFIAAGFHFLDAYLHYRFGKKGFILATILHGIYNYIAIITNSRIREFLEYSTEEEKEERP